MRKKGELAVSSNKLSYIEQLALKQRFNYRIPYDEKTYYLS